MAPTPTRHASPPEVTEKRGPARPATAPASTSPSRGPLVTTSENTDDMRPRIAWGVTLWLIVARHTALTESAAPATASSTAASHSDPARPASAIAAPHTDTAHNVMRPRRRACAIQPVVRAATVAPAATEAYSRPV